MVEFIEAVKCPKILVVDDEYRTRITKAIEDILKRSGGESLDQFHIANTIYQDVIRQIIWDEKEKWTAVIYNEIFH